MTLGKNHLFPLIAFAVLGAGYVVYVTLFPPSLTFEDRIYPPGFRELVLARAVSPPGPMFGIERTERDASKLDRKDICDALFRDPNSPWTGKAAAAVQVATFLDYRCPYCKTLSGLIATLPGDNFRIVFHEWAILGSGSVLAARAALAADRQGKYLPIHARLMDARLLPTEGYIDAVAGDLGLDLARLHADMNSESVSLALRRTAALATTLGFVGTPALTVGRTIVQGEISRRQLEGLIAEEARMPKVC